MLSKDAVLPGPISVVPVWVSTVWKPPPWLICNSAVHANVTLVAPPLRTWAVQLAHPDDAHTRLTDVMLKSHTLAVGTTIAVSVGGGGTLVLDGTGTPLGLALGVGGTRMLVGLALGVGGIGTPLGLALGVGGAVGVCDGLPGVTVATLV